jgi:hypothetical protein
MISLSKVQRAGILKRLRQNKKYWAVIFYSGTRIEDVADAQAFASVLVEAGWEVSGPEASERVFADGLRIGVRDPRDPCPCARLLLDTLIAVGIDARTTPAGDFLSSTLPISCCLLVGS